VRTVPVALSLAVALLVIGVACGSAEKRSAAPDVARPVTMTATPARALRICRHFPLLRPACPHAVPRGGYTHASSPTGFNGLGGGGAIVVCTNHGARSGPITQGRCVSPSWIFEAGAPAGLPPDAPPNVRGKRVAYGRRTRPPHYVHIIIYGEPTEPGTEVSVRLAPRDRSRRRRPPSTARPDDADSLRTTNLGWQARHANPRSTARVRRRERRPPGIPVDARRD
jgi:hypothetical protein